MNENIEDKIKDRIVSIEKKIDVYELHSVRVEKSLSDIANTLKDFTDKTYKTFTETQVINEKLKTLEGSVKDLEGDKKALFYGVFSAVGLSLLSLVFKGDS